MVCRLPGPQSTHTLVLSVCAVWPVQEALPHNPSEKDINKAQVHATAAACQLHNLAHSAPAVTLPAGLPRQLWVLQLPDCQQNHHPVVTVLLITPAHVVVVRLSWDSPPQQDQQVACMDACAKEYTAKVPKLQKDCQSGMKQLGA